MDSDPKRVLLTLLPSLTHLLASSNPLRRSLVFTYVGHCLSITPQRQSRRQLLDNALCITIHAEASQITFFAYFPYFEETNKLRLRDHIALCVSPPIVARQLFGKHVPSRNNRYPTTEEILDASFAMRFLTYQRKVGD
jgi:hypothetical protein